VQAAAFFASRSGFLAEKAMRLAPLAAAFALGTRAADRKELGLRTAFSALRGYSDDRLAILAEEYVHQRLSEPDPAAMALWQQCRRDGQAMVLTTELPDVIGQLVAKQLGADHLIANRLEVVAGKCTGRLEDPLVLARSLGERAKALALAQGWALPACRAVGSQDDDALLMQVVGRPCAVRPAPPLRRLARQLDWPVYTEAS
jgi:phosphoserine phosphatase